MKNRNEQPIHAPLTHSPMRVNVLPPKHHLQKGEEKRVRLSGGPFVDPATLAQLAEWHHLGPSFGELIDRLTAHAQATGFDPLKTIFPAPQQ
jgi:hypothetical protein